MPNRPEIKPTTVPESPPVLPELPELLAPAGSLDALKAAISNGADAVYLGASRFSARGSAINFTEVEMAEGLTFAHQRSARVYLALNILIADDEGSAALEQAAAAFTAGVDAVIVQDLGLASVLRRSLPDLPLFASTQMSIHDAAGLQAVARLGIRRVILPRELSLAEIRELAAQARQLNLDTEVFIHGALCICYSGQCLLSSLIGGRSGNRGSCAQPCRLPWILHGPGLAAIQATVQADSSPYPWLSPRDQAMPEYLAELAQAGVTSFKIEGRMRNSATVGQTVAAYRTILERLTFVPGEGALPPGFTAARRQLLQAFNRGGNFTSRYIGDRQDNDFLTGNPVGSHGLLWGTVTALEPQRGVLRITPTDGWPTDISPARGDILVIRRPGDDQEIASAPIGEISSQGPVYLVRGFHPDVLGKLRTGDPVFRMTDHLAEQKALQTDLRRTEATLDLQGGTDDLEPVRLTVTAKATTTVRADQKPDQGRIPDPLVVTVSRPAEPVAALFPERVKKQLQKTGGTPFQVSAIEQNGVVHLSIASLNELRRQALQELADKLAVASRRALPTGFTTDWKSKLSAFPGSPADMKREARRIPNHTQVTVFWHRLPDDPADIACGADLHYLPILSLADPGVSELIRILRHTEPGCSILAWLPPVVTGPAARLLPELLDRLPEWGLDGICAGHPSLDLLASRISPASTASTDSPASPIRPISPTSPTSPLILAADTSANIFNQATLRHYAAIGATSACPSLELSVARLQPLLEAALLYGIQLELPLYGRLRLMTSRFCPVGQNLPGCRRCQKSGRHPDRAPGLYPGQAGLFSLEDRRQDHFPLLPQPRACSSELYSHFLLSSASEISGLLAENLAGPDNQPPAGASLRLYFLQETLAERRSLTALARRLQQARDLLESKRIAGLFQDQAEQIAARLGCRTGRGYDQRYDQRSGGITKP